MRRRGLIDMHCHILPGIDDGSADFDASIAIARRYTENGFSMVTATPHNIQGSAWSASSAKIDRLVDQLQEKLEKHQISLRLVKGMEIAVSDQFWRLLEKGTYIPLGRSTTYLLEFPFQQEGKQTIDSFCRQLAAQSDRRFLLAHPERLEVFQSSLKRLEMLHDNGCTTQLNFGSLLGWYGRKSQKTALTILERGMCHIISTDCHGTTNRDVPTAKQLSLLGQMIGEENFQLALKTNPVNILHNKAMQPLQVPQGHLEKIQTQSTMQQKPLPPKKGSFLKTLTNFLK